MSRINYNDKKVHNKNPLYRFLLRTVDFQIITSIGFCLLLFIFFFSFDVIIITRNKRNVNIKSDKNFIKLKYTENSENIVKYADIQNSD